MSFVGFLLLIQETSLLLVEFNATFLACFVEYVYRASNPGCGSGSRVASLTVVQMWDI